MATKLCSQTYYLQFTDNAQNTPKQVFTKLSTFWENSHQCQQVTGAETGAGNDEGLEIVASVVLTASVISISGWRPKAFIKSWQNIYEIDFPICICSNNCKLLHWDGLDRYIISYRYTTRTHTFINYIILLPPHFTSDSSCVVITNIGN